MTNREQANFANKTHVVITTEYGKGTILAIYGPLTQLEAENLRRALPASATRDHDVHELRTAPTFNFSDYRK